MTSSDARAALARIYRTPRKGDEPVPHNRPPLTLDKLIAELDRVAVNTYMAGDQAAAALQCR